MDDLMRRMRGHVGYDPKQVIANPERYNRAERRAHSVYSPRRTRSA